MSSAANNCLTFLTNYVQKQTAWIHTVCHRRCLNISADKNSSRTFVAVKMGLDVRKPVFGGLRTTQAQTSLRIRVD